ncbi:hypothetical protein [Leekyejoonella antrihumi]|uniref:DUF4352 domain-containing protein n=1 Tax=Leekyejoonella antrihumi TaxID=1660198 RepID=A0A563E2X8_9MICO|nr:hypothetical protein [Leekyejoonella antrihumi]TWP36552.1 hypothetical protein FGL98_10115 [Leekyejoonella antrihumi]
MVTVARRALVGASLGALALTGCQSGSTSSTSSGPSAAAVAGCAGGSAPTFTGKPTAYDAPAPVEPGKSVSAQVGQPAVTAYPSGHKGVKIVQIQVGAQVLTNGVFAISPGSFLLADAKGHLCPQPKVDPLPKSFPALQVDESHPGAGGVAFLVPEGADLSTFSVYYTNSAGSAVAAAKWTANGGTRNIPVGRTCDGPKSTFSLKGVKNQSFGRGQTIGDSTISLKLTAYEPTPRTLTPSAKQPNDVQGVAVHVRGAAQGALRFMGRSQFRLMDSSGILCRYNPLGSDGDTLTSTLVSPGKTRDFTLIFWIPRGAKVPGWKLLYLADPSKPKVTFYWTSPAPRKK